MVKPVKTSTPPDFSRRRARAQVTRARVLGSAKALFLERGYAATSVVSIAELADISPETIYSTFGNKRAILASLVDISIAGDADAPPVMHQDWVQELRVEPDQRRRVRRLAEAGRAILERRSDVDEIVRGAASADPEIAALRANGAAQRFAGQRELLRIVAGEQGLHDDLTIATGADILYAIGSPDTYRALVIDRGWTPERFETWYAQTIERLLFPDA